MSNSMSDGRNQLGMLNTEVCCMLALDELLYFVVILQFYST